MVEAIMLGSIEFWITTPLHMLTGMDAGGTETYKRSLTKVILMLLLSRDITLAQHIG
jgi:hypothetical protein